MILNFLEDSFLAQLNIKLMPEYLFTQVKNGVTRYYIDNKVIVNLDDGLKCRSCVITAQIIMTNDNYEQLNIDLMTILTTKLDRIVLEKVQAYHNEQIPAYALFLKTLQLSL